MTVSQHVKPVFGLLAHKAGKIAGLRDEFVLENFPLHTEEPKWAAQAPAQVASACRRGAHVIGLTETRRQDTLPDMKVVADGYGYDWYTAPYDRHRNVSLLVKRSLHVISHDVVLVNNNYMVSVLIRFHGSVIGVFQLHWEPSDNNKDLVQTEALIAAMTHASKGSRLAFYMGDSNPSKPQRVPGSQPNARLLAAGMPVVWQELGDYPIGVGVNVIGHNLADTRVKTLSAKLYPALGSDHQPAVAKFSIKRLKHKHA